MRTVADHTAQDGPDASFEWTIPGLPGSGEVSTLPHPDTASPRVG